MLKIDEIDYSEFVACLVKDGGDIIKSLTPEKADLWHMGTGVAGEAGELIDAIKKHIVYERDLDLENIKEELGDLEFYMQRIRDSLGITRQEVIRENKKKLLKRYETLQYSNEQAQERKDKQ